LVDKNGYFLQGWAAAPDGSFPASGALSSMRVDAEAFTSAGAPTTAASLSLNLPSDTTIGAAESYTIDVFDSAGQQRSMQFSFVKQDANNWSLVASGEPGDTVTVFPAPAIAFDAWGQPTGPLSYSINATFADNPTPTTAAFSLDVSGFTQFAGNFLAYDYTRDGYAPAALSGIEFNDRGEVIGRFDNGRTRPLYRLALADFANPDSLGQLPGNVYTESETSGQATVAGAGESGVGKINPGTLEKSNVDLAQEFGRMIQTQNAYNSSATAFRTIDEMTEVARDLA
jgi:flagellar hook protein FlgE